MFSLVSDAGKRLREKIVEPDAKVLFYFSPYLRTKQVSLSCRVFVYTFFCEKDILGIMEEPRIRYDLKIQMCTLFLAKFICIET